MPKATVGDILGSYLLGGSLYDAFSFEEFQAIFPPAYREHPTIRLMHTQYFAHRRHLKQSVRRNLELELALLQNKPASSSSADLREGERAIDRGLASLDAPPLPTTSTRVHFTEALQQLRRIEAAAEREMGDLDAECHELLREISSLSSKVHAKAGSTTRHIPDTEVDETCRRLKALEETCLENK